MENIDEIMPILKRFMDMLEKQLGKNCEIVLHDYNSTDYASTIVDIRNGHITNREIGGCGSNMGLEILRGISQEDDRYNYITYTNNGKILRSSTMHFWNPQHEMIGALCINLDITESVKFESFIREFNNFAGTVETGSEPERVDEIFASDVQELLEELIRRAFRLVGKVPSEMTREEKVQFIKYLDGKGAFIITKSSDRIQELLGISRYTFYNYLELARKQDEPQNGEGT